VDKNSDRANFLHEKAVLGQKFLSRKIENQSCYRVATGVAQGRLTKKSRTSTMAHPSWPGLEAAGRVGELMSTALGPSGAPFVLLPGAGGGQVRVSASGYTALSGKRLGRWARSPGVLALLERSATAMDRSCGGGTNSLTTMLAGAVRRIQARMERASCACARARCASHTHTRMKESMLTHRHTDPQAKTQIRQMHERTHTRKHTDSTRGSPPHL